MTSFGEIRTLSRADIDMLLSSKLCVNIRKTPDSMDTWCQDDGSFLAYSYLLVYVKPTSS